MELQEHCFLCDSPLDNTGGTSSSTDVAADAGQIQCRHPETPHRLARCMETLRVVASAECWECPLCAAVARPHLPLMWGGKGGGATGDAAAGYAWSFETRPAWLAPFHGGGGVWCLFCHVPCRLLNAP
jgi:hypothetical protein